MLNKINVVLTGVDDESKRGVLSMEIVDESLKGQLRLFGFKEEPRGILSLGLTSENGVVKAGLTKKNNMLYTFSSAQEVQKNFSCAVVNFVEGEPKAILFGATNNKTVEEQLETVLGALKSSQNVEQVKQTLDEYGVDFDDQLKEEIESEIDEHMSNIVEEVEAENNVFDCAGDCKRCIYKKSFYQENVQNLAKNDENTIKIVENEENLTGNVENTEEKVPEFFGKIKNQVDQIFSKNQEEEFLQNAIPQSKWVKVDIDDGRDYYVFGLIYDNDELRYVCYGVPGIFTPLPPKQLSGYPVWFPVDKDKKEGFGYWLSYQDASTGESVKAIIE